MTSSNDEPDMDNDERAASVGRLCDNCAVTRWCEALHAFALRSQERSCDDVGAQIAPSER